MVYCYFVGKFKEKKFLRAVEDYHLRLKRLWPVTVQEVPENPKDVAKLVEAKKNKGLLVSLDPEGQGMDSPAFIRWVTQSSLDIHFFAWGANGPAKDLSRVQMKSLSLSPMTYSHELARVLLMEQLYRAGATLKGHPYPR